MPIITDMAEVWVQQEELCAIQPSLEVLFHSVFETTLSTGHLTATLWLRSFVFFVENF